MTYSVLANTRCLSELMAYLQRHIAYCSVNGPVEAKGKDYTGINSNIQFAINSSPTEVVNSWPHLGHAISSDINDKSDIERCHSKLVAQINCELCSFGRIDANIKTTLLIRVIA